ncbi:MAG: 3-phosphoserine/phosphohydroxythreonine transaminase, partial [Myxococcota bacterium]
MARIHNFSAGPAALPLPVLERVQRELIDFDGTGMSIMEQSHRGPTYERVHHDAIARLRTLLALDDRFEVLLLQGGASLQFAMVPINFLGGPRRADYVVTGTWGKKAVAEANRQHPNSARIAVDTHDESGFAGHLPASDALELDPRAVYCHVTSNNTIMGTQFRGEAWPETDGVPLVADVSSDYLGRRLPLDRFGLIYGGAQKNIGPSGLCVVIAKKSFLAQANADITNILSYRAHLEKNSTYHTPNTFAVYVMWLVLQWLEDQGGLDAMATRNDKQAASVYAVLDAYPDFYRPRVAQADRSVMNVTFSLPTPELDQAFVAEAQAKGMNGLKGHRSVGGIRASLYNATPDAAVEAHNAFMDEFSRRHRKQAAQNGLQ